MNEMIRVARKPLYGVSDQVRHKPEGGLRLEIFGFKEKKECTIQVAKTKALISFAVIAKLICVFVFAYAKSGQTSLSPPVIHY